MKSQCQVAEQRRQSDEMQKLLIAGIGSLAMRELRRE
jgi:hypothetical protein